MFMKVAFTYYPVTDVARARKFYEETLGLKSAAVSEPPRRAPARSNGGVEDHARVGLLHFTPVRAIQQ